MKVDSMPFSKIINIDQGAREHYHVPKYQREYSWRVSHWEKLIQDIDENDIGYFMGSIICVSDAESNAPGEELIYEVIDGQQRLVTLSLLIMAIYTRLKEMEKSGIEFEDEDDKRTFQKTLDSLSEKIVKKKKDFKKGEPGGFEDSKRLCFCRVQPSSQNHNYEDYLYIISELGLISKRESPRYCGVRSIYKAFRYFQKTIPQEVESLQKFVEKINLLDFVVITVGTQADAFTLFETLNNRGLELSAIDIIKNKMLSEMEKKHEVHVDESFDYWQEIIKVLPGADDQERFFRHFYNAFRKDKTFEVKGISRAVKSKIIKIYETLIKRDTVVLFDSLREKAVIYGRFIDPSSVEDEELAARLEDMSHIGTAPAYQILLFLFSQDKRFVTPDLLPRVADLMCKYYVRRNVTDIPSTRDLDQAHMEVIDLCHEQIKKSKTLTFEFFANCLVNNSKARPASLKQFREALGGSIYSDNADMARYLLTKLDSEYHTKEYSPDLWARDEKGRFIWTVEHIFPQGENISHDWIEMIGNGNRKIAENVQEKYVHCLGNLTLSGYNSNLSDASFAKKQQLAKNRIFLGQKINIGYRNGLALNNLNFVVGGKTMNLSNASGWKENMIEARTKAISDILISLYKFPVKQLQ